MLKDLIIHPKTSRAVQMFANSPSHAVLLSGPTGSGKRSIARALAAELLGIDGKRLDSHPHFTHLAREEGKKDIPIEAVRRINKLLALKVPSKNAVKRVALIEDAQLMNTEAQNAFLKSLEEPAEGTIFILTTSSKSALLPTVVSRATSVVIHPVDMQSALDYYPGRDEQEVITSWRLSQGSPGLLSVLLGDEPSELKSAVQKAKELLKKSRYERLLELDTIAKDKAEFANLLDGLSRVIKALYRAAAQSGKTKQTKSLTEAMKLVMDARRDLDANVLPRLIALKLTLNLPV